MNETLLDRPVWHALTGPQARFAVGGQQALRFHPDIGPLSSAERDDEEGMAALAALVPADGPLFTVQALAHPDPPEIAIERRPALQMVAAYEEITPEPSIDMTRLFAPDAAEMLTLAQLTEPGPFGIRTGELGQFWGVWREGVLVAMAGERLRVSGFSEVSGVCTLPGHRGHGYARALMLRVMRQIRERGEVPFLTTYADNMGAISLYESIGFRIRTELTIGVLKRETGCD